MADKDLGALIGIGAPKNVSDLLYQKISGLILSGELEEGYTFPNEPTLCEQLGVGRTSLREAYKALELTGYVTRTKRGTTVNSRGMILSATPIKTAFSTASKKDFGEFRLMLEGESAYYAALHAGLDDACELEEAIEEQAAARASGDYELLRTLDMKFHRRIADLSENSLIQTTVSVANEALESSTRENFFAAASDDGSLFDLMLDQHRAIADAIRGRDCLRARDAMRDHIESMSAQRFR